MSPGQGLRPGRGLFLFQFIVLEEKLDIKFIYFLPPLFLLPIFGKKNIKNIDISL